MPTYQIPAKSGVYKHKTSVYPVAGHIVTVSPNSGKTITAGSLVVETRAPGAPNFEVVPDGTLGLATPHSLLFTFAVAEFRFTLTGFAGTSDKLYITDTFAEL